MATLSKGYTFGVSELVTNTKLSNLIDLGTVTAIVNADIDAAAAIVGSKLNLAAPGIIGGTTPAAITGTAITGTSMVIGGADINETDLEKIDGITNGTAYANKALVLGASKEIATITTLTATSLVGALTGNCSGSSGSCTGNSATATLASTVTVDATTTDTTCFVGLFESASGSLEPQTDATLTYQAVTGILTATGFAGDLTGNATGSSGSCTGNSATVTGLTLNGESLTMNTGALTLTPAAADSSVLTIGAGAVAVSGSNTGDNAANSSSTYIGTTAVALNRSSAVLTLAGITLTTPNIGTPSGGTLTNCTGLPMAGVVAGTLATGTAIPSGAGGTTVDAVGEICVDSTSDTLNFNDGTLEAVIQPIISKSLTVEDPTATEDIGMFYTDDAITIVKVVIAIVGSDTPSVTWDIRHHTDRSNAGNALITSPAASAAGTSALTTGHVITSFNDATIAADSFIWAETDAQSGTVDEANITIFFRQDA